MLGSSTDDSKLRVQKAQAIAGFPEHVLGFPELRLRVGPVVDVSQLQCVC